MTHDSPQQASSSNDAPPFPHHAAPPPIALEAAERQSSEPQPGVPRWQPEEGDFN